MRYTPSDIRSTEPISMSAYSYDAETVVVGRLRFAAEETGYHMSLNPSDTADVIKALFVAAEETGDADFHERLRNLISGFATTVNVELI